MTGRKKYAWLGDMLCNVIGGVREYRANKVTYIVEAKCKQLRGGNIVMPQEKFAKLIKNHSAHLTWVMNDDTIKAEYVLDTAGEEDYADQNETE